VATVEVLLPQSVQEEVHAWRPEAVQQWVVEGLDLPKTSRITRRELYQDFPSLGMRVKVTYVYLADA
jgi:hypothetical protein